MEFDKEMEPAPAWGQVSILVDPVSVKDIDERALSDATFDLVTKLLENRGITFDFDPSSDSEMNKAYMEAMDALHESIVETTNHSMYIRHWALGVLARAFHSGDLLALFESDDPEMFGERAAKVASHITKSAAVAIAATAAALVVFPNNEEYESPENAVRRLVQFGVKFFNDDDANVASLAVQTVDEMDPDDDWDEYVWGEPDDE